MYEIFFITSISCLLSAIVWSLFKNRKKAELEQHFIFCLLEQRWHVFSYIYRFFITVIEIMDAE